MDSEKGRTESKLRDKTNEPIKQTSMLNTFIRYDRQVTPSLAVGFAENRNQIDIWKQDSFDDMM